jgi:hypothetical protein
MKRVLRYCRAPAIGRPIAPSRISSNAPRLQATVRSFKVPPQQPDLPAKMSSDADYEAFLNKANQDTGSAAKSKTAGIKSINTAVPKTLEQIDTVFVSDSDEPFEPISLSFEGGSLPTASVLSDLIGEKVEKIDEKAFDPRGQYSSVVRAVKDAGDGPVAFFKVQHDGTRIEYLVVSVDAGNKRLVGLKALSVES